MIPDITQKVIAYFESKSLSHSTETSDYTTTMMRKNGIVIDSSEAGYIVLGTRYIARLWIKSNKENAGNNLSDYLGLTSKIFSKTYYAFIICYNNKYIFKFFILCHV